MLEKIGNLVTNGISTLKGLLKLEWLNFKNWKGWTSLRALYLLCARIAVLCPSSARCVVPAYTPGLVAGTIGADRSWVASS